ncbi:hypothetical protein MSG28_000172, partial [Choristoneura fumiferana]
FFSDDNGSTHVLYLETIVEETSDDLRSERSSVSTLSDSEADSVIPVRGNADARAAESLALPMPPRGDVSRDRAHANRCSDSQARVGVPREAAAARARGLAGQHGLAVALLQPRAVRVAGALLRRTRLAQPVARLTGLPRRVPLPAHLPPAPRAHLSAENLSEDSGYSERARRPPPLARRPPEIAHGAAAGSAPNLASPGAERRPARAARAVSLPAELDVCAEPRRRAATSRARFRQAFEVTDSLTVSVADLTALDYRGGRGARASRRRRRRASRRPRRRAAPTRARARPQRRQR